MTLITKIDLSPNKYDYNYGHIFIGIHTMEAPEAGGTAEAVARYFGKPEIQASAHWCVDNKTRVRCVHDHDSAWTMYPVNEISLNIEMAGFARQTPVQWADAYSLAVLDNAALCAAEWCHKYNIPIRHLTHEQIAEKHKGFLGHADANAVFHGGDHWDPGPNFPWAKFLMLVRNHVSRIARPPLTRPDCTAFQRVIHVADDNQWGPLTDKHATALIKATAFGGHRFPWGIAFTQRVIGTADDGIWGPNSRTALTHTVTLAQLALRSMGFDPKGIDGSWGPNTDGAYHEAVKACHI